MSLQDTLSSLNTRTIRKYKREHHYNYDYDLVCTFEHHPRYVHILLHVMSPDGETTHNQISYEYYESDDSIHES